MFEREMRHLVAPKVEEISVVDGQWLPPWTSRGTASWYPVWGTHQTHGNDLVHEIDVKNDLNDSNLVRYSSMFKC
jgi:hypothetical protein